MVDYTIIVIDRIFLTNVSEAIWLFYFITNIELNVNGGWDMEVVSGALFAIEESIRTKLIAVGATSQEKAATSQDAHLDMQEQNWIHYIAGGLFAMVKKTGDGRFYVSIYN